MKEKTTSLIMAIKDEKPKKLDLPLLKEAFEMAVREDGWSHLGEFGNRLLQAGRRKSGGVPVPQGFASAQAAVL